MQEVVTGLGGNPDKLYSDGLHVGGERFVLTKAEDRSLYARKVGTTSQLDICLWCPVAFRVTLPPVLCVAYSKFANTCK